MSLLKSGDWRNVSDNGFLFDGSVEDAESRLRRISRSRIDVAASYALERLEERRLLTATLVKDINPAVTGADTTQITDVAGSAFYVASKNSADLYHSDGTPAGTNLVRSYSTGLGPAAMTASGSLLYYRAGLGTGSGVRQIWRSDGTAAGTIPVTAFTYSGVSIDNLTDVNGVIYFSAEEGTGAKEVWKSDGTVGGTVKLKDVNGTNPTPDFPGSFTNVNGTLYFTANDGVNGVELWRSDGTSSGTVMVADIRPGSTSSTPRNLTAVGSTLFFTVDDGVNGQEVWKSDGTAAGTVLVKDIVAGSGTSSPSQLTALNGQLYFTASTTAHGNELWRSDGTAAGTTEVADLWSGTTGSAPSTLRVYGGNIYFSAATPDSLNPTGPGIRQMWKSDGTAAGR